MFENPAVYQTFVRSLCDSIEPKLSGASDDVAVQAAGLTRLLNLMPPKGVQQSRVFVEFAYRAMQADPPDLILVWAIGFLCGFSERSAQNFVIGSSSVLNDTNPSPAKPAQGS